VVVGVNSFRHRVQRELGSLAAALRGVDSIVFTGGIDENAALIRARVYRDAAWFGVELDEGGNATSGPRISTKGHVSAWVVPTNEELMIARHTASVLGLR